MNKRKIVLETRKIFKYATFILAMVTTTYVCLSISMPVFLGYILVFLVDDLISRIRHPYLDKSADTHWPSLFETLIGLAGCIVGFILTVVSLVPLWVALAMFWGAGLTYYAVKTIKRGFI
jgi:hypothetical protein